VSAERATIGGVTLLFTLLTLAVLGVIAAVATGRITGGLEEPSTSLPSRGLPEGTVGPEAIDAVRFAPALRGYRMEEVDAVLDRLGAELDRRDREILQLRNELRLAERAYRGHAARAAAAPEWASPTTGAIYPGAVDPARSYAAQGFGAAGYQDQQAHPDQQTHSDQQAYPDQGFAPSAYPGPDPRPEPGWSASEPGYVRPGGGYAGQGDDPGPADAAQPGHRRADPRSADSGRTDG
jgi:DivIVA domain-containing protein